jgi:nucleoid DNA-binding protein
MSEPTCHLPECLLNEGYSMSTLTKRGIVVQISNGTGIPQNQVFKVLQSTLDLITETLSRGQAVELRNFGVLDVRLTKPRVGRNPSRPGSRYVIPERATVRFKAGKLMRQRVTALSKDIAAQDSGLGSSRKN